MFIACKTKCAHYCKTYLFIGTSICIKRYWRTTCENHKCKHFDYETTIKNERAQTTDNVTWDQHPRLVRLWERETSFLGQSLLTWRDGQQRTLELRSQVQAQCQLDSNCFLITRKACAFIVSTLYFQWLEFIITARARLCRAIHYCTT